MKSKKILTILLSLAIMFTFMPAMAFATDWTDTSVTPNVKHTYNWDANYGTGITIDGEHYPATVTYLGGGQLKATPNVAGTAGIPAALLAAIGSVTYYDLSYAAFASGSDAVASKYLKSANYTAADGFAFSVPTTVPYDSSVPAASQTAANRKAVVALTTLNGLGAWQGTIKGDADYLAKYGVTKSTEDQTFTLNLSVSYLSTGSVDVVGSIADFPVTVVGRDGTTADALFFMDKVATTGGSTTTVTGIYDGAKHTVVMKPVKGYTVKYTKFNKTTNNWDPVDAVEITDVETINAKAQLYDDKGAAAGNPFTLTVSLTKAEAPNFGWVENDSKVVNYDVVEGTEYNPADYVEPVAYVTSTTSPTDQDKANVKATAANAELFKAYFNDFFEVTAKNSKANPDQFTLTIKAKDLSGLSPEERKALGKKYAAIDKNFGVQTTLAPIDSTTGAPFWTAPTGVGSTRTLRIVPASTDYEVEFTKAITSKTYKGSKTTKKGKLKKNQTIQFTAEAVNGAAVVYKLVGVNTSKITIDKTTGKVTLKKGLAKGTYKFKVKAYVPNHQTQTTGFEVQNVTIKVKK